MDQPDRAMKRITALILALLLAAGTLAGCGGKRPTLAERIDGNGAVVAAIRKGLREHSACLTLRFSYGEDVLSELSGLVGEWMEQALAETERPDEGDYLRYQMGGYEAVSRCETADGLYRYTVEIRPDYYMYLVEEEAVTRQLEEIVSGFGFTESTPELEKIRTIYDYVCSTVGYDHVHAGRTTATKRSTAYAALIWHTATCQGYCVTLYRLLRMAGLDARVVTGMAGDEFHAWNLVGLDGRYYLLDATWDAGHETYTWFLRGKDALSDHRPGDAFAGRDFLRRYPMAAQDYFPNESEGKEMG